LNRSFSSAASVLVAHHSHCIDLLARLACWKARVSYILPAIDILPALLAEGSADGKMDENKAMRHLLAGRPKFSDQQIENDGQRWYSPGLQS
jgi:hypothetical protein